MRSEKSKALKAQKSRARMKDFVRRRNINANVPMVKKEIEVQKFKPKLSMEGKVISEPTRNIVDHKKKMIMKASGNPILVPSHKKTVVVKEPVYNHSVVSPRGDTWPRIDNRKRNTGMIEYPASKKYRGKKPKNNNKK